MTTFNLQHSLKPLIQAFFNFSLSSLEEVLGSGEADPGPILFCCAFGITVMLKHEASVSQILSTWYYIADQNLMVCFCVQNSIKFVDTISNISMNHDKTFQ